VKEKMRNFKDGLLTGFKSSGSGRDDYDYEEDEDFEGYEDEDDDYEPPKKKAHKLVNIMDNGKKRGGDDDMQILNMNMQMQVVLSQPKDIGDAFVVCDHTRAGKTVIVNLQGVPSDSAQRIIDFLGGAAYAMEGDFQIISNKVFIIAPKNVSISDHFKAELKDTGVLYSFKTGTK
jgi:cell division inhibitor SepF